MLAVLLSSDLSVLAVNDDDGDQSACDPFSTGGAVASLIQGIFVPGDGETTYLIVVVSRGEGVGGWSGELTRLILLFWLFLLLLLALRGASPAGWLSIIVQRQLCSFDFAQLVPPAQPSAASTQPSAAAESAESAAAAESAAKAAECDRKARRRQWWIGAGAPRRGARMNDCLTCLIVPSFLQATLPLPPSWSTRFPR